MCQYCLQSPCHPRCPNAPDPPRVYTCSYCGEGIIEDDDYMEIEGEYYHLDCVEDNAIEIFISLFNARKGVATSNY